MATVAIEDRVAALESEVAQLKRKLAAVEQPTKAWWKRIAGTFADDAAHEAAMQLGRSYRQAQTPEES
jgi:hypothetical protein